jgi:hypothetical protein
MLKQAGVVQRLKVIAEVSVSAMSDNLSCNFKLTVDVLPSLVIPHSAIALSSDL